MFFTSAAALDAVRDTLAADVAALTPETLEHMHDLLRGA
jgi:hypothetical protein